MTKDSHNDGVVVVSSRPAEAEALFSSDPLRSAILAGRLAFCEEVARDGAQAKTLLNARQRIEVARRHAEILGGSAEGNLVFAAGFPAICAQEFGIVEKVAAEVDFCQVMAVCRATSADVLQATASVVGAKHARIMVVVPVSEQMAQCMTGESADVTCQKLASLLLAVNPWSQGVRVDIAFADAPRAELATCTRWANRFTAMGVSTIVLCDTVGCLRPEGTRAYFQGLLSASDSSVCYCAHFHNDLGFAAANASVAFDLGINYFASSWLGLGERSGMLATEQWLAVLGLHDRGPFAEAVPGRGGWSCAPDLSGIVPLARWLAAELEIELGVTAPIVGKAVNTWATGTPVKDVSVFSAFDAEEVLGVEARFLITHLASHRLVRAELQNRGLPCDRALVARVLQGVKDHCYAHGHSEILPDDLNAVIRNALLGRESEVA